MIIPSPVVKGSEYVAVYIYQGVTAKLVYIIIIIFIYIIYVIYLYIGTDIIICTSYMTQKITF